MMLRLLDTSIQKSRVSSLEFVEALSLPNHNSTALTLNVPPLLRLCVCVSSSIEHRTRALNLHRHQLGVDQAECRLVRYCVHLPASLSTANLAIIRAFEEVTVMSQPPHVPCLISTVLRLSLRPTCPVPQPGLMLQVCSTCIREHVEPSEPIQPITEKCGNTQVALSII